MASDNIELNVKMINETITVTVDKNGSISNIKEKVKEKMGAKETDQKLIYKGKILKDDDKIETHNIHPGDSLHLVVKKAQPKTEDKPEAKTEATAAPGAAAGMGMPGMGMGMPGMGMFGMGMPGMPNMQGMGGMGGMDSNFLQAQMEMMLANPQLMQAALNNPMMAQMAQTHPELQFMLSNPEMVRSIMTPENIRMAMSMMQSMRGMPSGMPGMNPFMGMGAGMPAPVSSAPTTSAATGAPSSAVPGAAPTATSPPNAYPNYAQMMSMFNPYGMAPGAFPAVPSMPTTSSAPAASTVPAEDLKVKYAAQLQQMKDMGFTNEDVNIETLKAVNGNVAIAIERLLTMLK